MDLDVIFAGGEMMQHDGCFPFVRGGDSLEEEVLIADLASVGGVGEIPEEDLHAAFFIAADIGRRVGRDEFGASEERKVLVCPVGGLRDALIGHEAESAVERTRRGAVFLEDVRERPETHGIQCFGIAELFQNERAGEEGIVYRIDGRIRGVPLRDVDGKFLFAFLRDNGEGLIRAVADVVETLMQEELAVAVLVESAGAVAEAVSVIGNEVEREFLLVAVVDQFLDEDRARAGGAADGVILVDGFHGLGGMFVEFEVFGETVFFGETPEDIEVRFIPDLETPGLDFIRAVTVGPVLDERPDEGIPLLVFFRRGHVGFPPEDRILVFAVAFILETVGREFFRHESEFDEGLHADGEQEIVHIINIHEVVDGIAFLILGVHAHFIVEQAVRAKITESEFLVAVFQLLAPGVAETFSDPSGSDTVAPDHGTRSFELREVGFDNAGFVLFCGGNCSLFFHELAP